MQRHIYKALLMLLRVLVYFKRFVFWVLGAFWEAWRAISDVYSRTLGFRLYKIWFLCKKQLIKWKIPLDSRLLEVLGRRGTLQMVLFLVGVFLMLPYTRLYTQELGGSAGEDTVLFAMVGPGDGYYELEEIAVDVTDLQTSDPRTWRRGAVSADTAAPGAIPQPGFTNQELSSISAGGSAVTKPTIITGVDVPSAPGSPLVGPGARTQVIDYIVKPGDVIGRIAESFGISVETILWANNLSIRSYIRPGDKLKILPRSGLLHTVKRGDTISKIARTYDTDAEKIIAANKLQAGGSDIVVGEQLVIPDGRKPYVAPVRRVAQPSAFRSISAPPPSVNAPAGSGYIWPVIGRRISQYFGLRHNALDLPSPLGSPLYASRAGRVIKSQCGWNGGYGCYIIIDHGGGVTTRYAHNSQLYVSVGDQVVQGQTIAAIGSTGRSTGPHVHFEVRVNGRVQNPLKYIK